MRKLFTKLSLLQFLLVAALFITGCSKEETTVEVVVPEVNWIVSTTNIMLGNQYNTTAGHFLQPQTGKAIALENVGTQQKSLAMFFFTEGSDHAFLTFPGNGTEAVTFGTAGIRLFTQSPVGLNFWGAGNLNTGKLSGKNAITPAEFNALLAAPDWTIFDATFEAKAISTSTSNYALGMSAGDVFFVKFNGLVRAIISVKNVVIGGTSGGYIQFDMIIEGRSIYTENTMASQIQPLRRVAN